MMQLQRQSFLRQSFLPALRELKWVLYCLIFLLLILQSKGLQYAHWKTGYKIIPRHLHLIQQQVGKAENPKGSNRGKFVDEVSKPLQGIPWCAALQKYNAKAAYGADWLSGYYKRSGGRFDARAISFKNNTSVGIKHVIYGLYHIQPGDYRIKSRKGGNHIDVFESDSTLIGGNVNDKVARRTYNIATLLRDGTTFVTPFHRVPVYDTVLVFDSGVRGFNANKRTGYGTKGITGKGGERED